MDVTTRSFSKRSGNFRTRLIVPALAAMALMLGCSDDFSSSVGKFADQVGGLFAIKKLVDQQITEGESGIHIQNGRTITVSLVNTNYNEDSFENRKSVAIKIAHIISDHILDKPEYQSVENIVIAFVQHEKKFLIVDFSRTFDVFPFGISELRQATSSEGVKI